MSVDYATLLARQRGMGEAPAEGRKMSEGPAFACPGRSQKKFNNRLCWAAMPVTDEGPQCTLRQCRMKRNKKFFNLCEAHYDGYMAALQHEPALAEKHIFDVVEPFVAGEPGDPAVDRRTRSARKGHQYGLLYAYNEVLPKYNEAFAKLRMLINNSRAVTKALEYQNKLKRELEATKELDQTLQRKHAERAQAIADAVQRANNGRASGDEVEDAVEGDGGIQDLRVQVDALREREAKLEAELGARQTKLAAANERAKELQEANAKLISAREKLEKIQNEYPNLDGDMAELKALRAAAEGQLGSYTKRVATLEAEVQRLQGELEKANIKNSGNDGELSEIKQSLADASAMIKQLENQRTEDLSAIASHVKETDALKTQIAQREEDLATTRDEVKQRESEMNELRENLARQQEELERLKLKQEAFDALNATYAANAANALEEEIQKNERLAGQMREELAKKNAQIEQAKRMEREIKELKEQLEQLRAVEEALRADANKRVKGLKAELRLAQKEAFRGNTDAAGKISNLEGELKSANERVKTLESEIATIRAKSRQTVVERNNAEIRRLNAKVVALESQLQDRGDTAADIREQLRTKNEALSEATARLASMTAENNRLNEQIRQLKADHAQAVGELEARYAALQASHIELQAEKAALVKRVEELGQEGADAAAAGTAGGPVFDNYPVADTGDAAQTGFVGRIYNTLSGFVGGGSGVDPVEVNSNTGGDVFAKRERESERDGVGGGALGGGDAAEFVASSANDVLASPPASGGGDTVAQPASRLPAVRVRPRQGEDKLAPLPLRKQTAEQPVVQLDDMSAADALFTLIQPGSDLNSIGKSVVGEKQYALYVNHTPKKYRLPENTILYTGKGTTVLSAPVAAKRAAVVAHLLCGKPQVVAAVIQHVGNTETRVYVKKRLVFDLINAAVLFGNVSDYDEDGEFDIDSLHGAFRSVVLQSMCSNAYLTSLHTAFESLGKHPSRVNKQEMDRYLIAAFHGINQEMKLEEYVRTRGGTRPAVNPYTYPGDGGAAAGAAPTKTGPASRLRPPRPVSAKARPQRQITRPKPSQPSGVETRAQRAERAAIERNRKNRK